MGPTFVSGQQAASSSAGSSVSGVFPSAITSGNSIVVAVSCDSDTVPSGTAVSDNNGNTYSLVKGEVGISGALGFTGATAIYQALNCNAGATTVTFNNTGNPGGTTFVGISVAEYTPTQATADATAGNNGTVTGTPNAGNLITSNADDLLLASATNEQSTTTWSAGASWNLRGNVTSATNTNIALQDQSVASLGTYSSAFSNSSTGGWTSAAAAVKAAATTSTTLPSLGVAPTLPKPVAAGWV